MNKKTIIAVYGYENEGKSSTVKKVCQKLIANFPDAIPSILAIDYSVDISVIVNIGSINIAVISEGDPHTSLLEDKLRLLRDEWYNDLDIILYAIRRDDERLEEELKMIVAEHDYHIIWLSSYFSRQDATNPLNSILLNHIASKSIIEIIEGLMGNKF